MRDLDNTEFGAQMRKRRGEAPTPRPPAGDVRTTLVGPISAFDLGALKTTADPLNFTLINGNTYCILGVADVEVDRPRPRVVNVSMQVAHPAPHIRRFTMTLKDTE